MMLDMSKSIASPAPATGTPPAPKLIHAFRAGIHTTSAGEKIEFTEAEMAATAAAYDPAIYAAPFVIGHPKSDSPAYGWAKGLVVDGADVYADPEQVQPEFAEMVNSGAFRNRSMKWYRPTDPGNPVPGVWYPQHIGFLGAMPPAIKGLKPAELAANDQGVEVEFGQWEDRTIAGLFRRLREWFIGAHGQETADKVIPGWDVDALAEEAARETHEVFPAPAFAEGSTIEEPAVTPEQAAALEAENAALKARMIEAENRDKAAKAAAIKTAAVQFCEGLIGEGKLLPAEKDSAVGLLVLAANAQPVEFGEGDGTVTDAPLARLEGLLKALPKRVEFGEHATREKLGANVDMTDATAIAAKAVEFQQAEAKAGREVSTSAAVKHITSQ